MKKANYINIESSKAMSQVTGQSLEMQPGCINIDDEQHSLCSLNS